MDHIVIFGELAHTLTHLLAVSVATETDHGVKSASSSVTQWWPDLFWLAGQIVAEKVILFHCEGMYPIVLLEILVVA